MSSSNLDLTALLGIGKEDLLTAMKKLTHIIQADKQFDVPQQQPPQNYYSPSKIDSKTQQRSVSTVMHETYDDTDLGETLKAARNDSSPLDVRNRLEESTLRNERNIISQSLSYSLKSPYVSLEKRLETTANLVNRLYQHDNQKKEKIATLQIEKYKEEISTLREKPEISLNSKIIAEKRNKSPIYNRYLSVMKQREENINKMRRELEETREDFDSSFTFQPDRSFTKKLKHERSRTPQEFANHVYAWQQRKNENIQREQYENITRELTELTFKPKINDKSRMIVKKAHGQKPVEARFKKYKEVTESKKELLLQKEKPTFRPVLNEKSHNLTKHRKGLHNKSSMLDKSVNLSYMDTSIGEENGRKTPKQRRSLSPGPLIKSKSNLHTSLGKQVSPKFNEINYTPAADFILKRFS